MTYRRPAPRRFNATEQTIISDLQATGRKMGMSNLRVNKHQDLMNPDADPSAEIVFDRGGRRYVVRCANYEHRLDNFRAAQRCISLLYQALEEYGATREAVALDETFDRLFLAFAATPDDTVLMLGDGRAPWWAVLGVDQSASLEEIRNAYRALAHSHHPDHGGNADEFKRLNAAYKAAVEERR